ncbi:MAG: T9SS type A sorting domain-containing protein [Bacteroidetes bacterium]|nr:T9SS type A sorting domain-containing protein [Bacteroidota bacterium]
MKTTCILLITFLLCNIGHAQFACDPRLKTDLADLYFDGPVNKMVVGDHYLYVGGSFNNVGHYTGAFVNINKITGYEQTRLAAVGARPYSFASGVPDSMGNLVVVGNYNKAGDSARSNISIINATTGKVTPLNIITDSIVNCAVVANGILYIGGYFNNVNGVPRSKIAAISMTTGALTSWSPGITNTGRPLPCRIETMVLNGTTLYVGGAFSNIGNTARNNIGAIDINTGSATSFAPDAYYSTAPTYGNVSKMLKIGNLLYICGGFDYVGGKIHGDVAAIDLSTGISTNWTPNPNSVVLGMNYKGDTLYLAGAFYKIDGQPRKSFAAYSIRTGNLLPIAIDTRIPVLEHIYDIAIANDTLYLAGSFDTIGNVARKNIAAFSRLDGTPFPFQSNINGEPRSLLHYYNKLYVGGYFTSGGMKARKYIAALDLDADTVVPWYPKINGNVSKIVPADGKVYISGDFTKVNDSTRHFNASVDGITGRTTSWDPQADTAFEDIAKYKGNIYMAGSFDSIRRNAINGLCKLDSNGVPQGWWCKPNGVVQHIAILHDSLYFSGLFSDVSGMARTSIASINLVGDSLNPWPIASDTIYNMRLIGDNLYVVIKTKVSKNNNYYFGHTIIQYLLYERQQNIRSIFPIVIQDHPATMGIIKDFVASNVRMYTVGIFDTVVHYPLGIQTFSSHKGVAFLNLSPDPQPNPPDFTITLNDFESNIQNRTSVDAIAIYGNKLYIGGDFYDWAGGYRYAQEYYLPYNIPEGNLSTDTNGVCSGQKATVRLHSSVTLGADYHWYVNGTAISNTLPYYTFVPANKDSISCVITTASNGCMHDGWDTTNAIVYDVTPTVTPDISISGPAAEEAGKQVVVKATVKDAATGYTIEWFNKGVSMGKTTVDSIVYTKGTGTDSIYAVITPRTDTCYVTDTSSLITIDEIPLGISSVTGDAGIKVYPNPFDTYVRIAGLTNGDVLQVYDVTGRKIWSSISTDKEYLLPTKEMHTGVYVLNVTDSSGIPKKHLLIEKR